MPKAEKKEKLAMLPGLLAFVGGVVVLMSAHGQETVYSFSGLGQNLGQTNAAPVQANDGNFYGTTYWGGDTTFSFGRGYGMVYKVTATGDLTTLTNFNGTNGGHPYASLIQGKDGNFYGTTYWGGNLNLNNGNGYGKCTRSRRLET